MFDPEAILRMERPDNFVPRARTGVVYLERSQSDSAAHKPFPKANLEREDGSRETMLAPHSILLLTTRRIRNEEEGHSRSHIVFGGRTGSSKLLDRRRHITKASPTCRAAYGA